MAAKKTTRTVSNSKTAVKSKTMDRKASKTPSDNRPKWPFVLFGALFGYMLSKAGATDYDTIIDMFRPFNVHVDRSPGGWYWHLDPLRLYGVLGLAMALIALGLFLLQKTGRPTLSGKPLDWESQAYNPDRILGSIVFGAGWALSGVCPGTALAQIGEGKVVALFTVVGIAAGIWAYQRFQPKAKSQETVC